MTPPKSPPQPAVSVEQAANEAAERMWRIHPNDLDRMGYVHKSHGGKHDNPRAAYYASEIIDVVKLALAAAPPADGVLRALQAQEDAEDARDTCSECDGEGQWEHCSICSLNFGRAIDLRRAALAGTRMAAFGASEAACYHYPGAHQQAERAAFCHGSEYAAPASLRASLTAKDAEIAALRAALEAFAKVAKHDIGSDEADRDLFRPMSKFNEAPLLTVGDLRRAARALHENPESKA